MRDFFSTVWTVLIFGSIAWYSFLLFYVGYKAAQELWQMTRRLAERNERTDE